MAFLNGLFFLLNIVAVLFFFYLPTTGCVLHSLNALYLSIFKIELADYVQEHTIIIWRHKTDRQFGQSVITIACYYLKWAVLLLSCPLWYTERSLWKTGLPKPQWRGTEESYIPVYGSPSWESLAYTYAEHLRSEQNTQKDKVILSFK